MLEPNDKISSYQLFMLIVGVVIGVGVVSLPRPAAKAAMQNGWVLPLIGGVVVIIDSYFIIKLGQTFPKQNFIEYSEKIVGKFFGKLLSLGLLLYFLLITSAILPIFALGIQPLLLNKTPTEVVYITMLSLLLYIARHGIEPIARLNQILTPVAIIVLLVLLAAVMTNPHIDYGRLQPVLTDIPITELFKKTFLGPGFFAFLGIESLYIIFPYLNKETQAKSFKVVTLALIFIILTYSVVVLLSIAHFGAEGTQMFVFPTLTLIREIQLPFFERIIAAFLAGWLVAGFTTTMIIVYAGAGLGLASFLNFREPKFLIPLAIIPPYFIGLIPQNIIQVFKFSDIVNYFGVVYLLILPPVLFGIYKLRNI